jgi:hypothetical protein
MSGRTGDFGVWLGFTGHEDREEQRKGQIKVLSNGDAVKLGQIKDLVHPECQFRSLTHAGWIRVSAPLLLEDWPVRLLACFRLPDHKTATKLLAG